MESPSEKYVELEKGSKRMWWLHMDPCISLFYAKFHTHEKIAYQSMINPGFLG